MCTSAADIRSLHCTCTVYCTRDGHFCNLKVNEQIEHFKCHYDPVLWGLYIICAHTEFVSKVLRLLQQVISCRCAYKGSQLFTVREKQFIRRTVSVLDALHTNWCYSTSKLVPRRSHQSHRSEIRSQAPRQAPWARTGS